jgi:uncharacterized membrane protein YeiH
LTVPSAAALATALEAAAVLISAVSGMITAAKKRMDIVGTYCLAVATALGGGTLRDLLIDRRPFFWVSHEVYLLWIVVLCVAFVYSRAFHERVRRWHNQAVLVDAMGLALFTLTGVGFALHQGMPPFVASLIGVVTGTFGGVIRDVASAEIPVIFRPGELYAVSSFAGAWVFLGAGWLGLSTVVAAALAFVTIVGLRMASVRFGVRVPDPLWLKDESPNGSPVPPSRFTDGESPSSSSRS